jgi:hypothetical protein
MKAFAVKYAERCNPMPSPLWQAEPFLFYPLVNTITLVISRKNLARFIQATEHQIKIIDAPTSQ